MNEISMRVKYPTNEEYKVMGRVDTDGKLSHLIVMTEINEEQENELMLNRCIRLRFSDRIIQISNTDCYAIGEVDFNSDDDISLINIFRWTSNLFHGNFIPRNYDYKTNTGDLYRTNGGLRCARVETFDNVKMFKFAYASIGKPKRIAVYTIGCKKHNFTM